MKPTSCLVHFLTIDHFQSRQRRHAIRHNLPIPKPQKWALAKRTGIAEMCKVDVG